MSTTIKKEIGKITNVSYGFGGYQDEVLLVDEDYIENLIQALT